MQKDEYCMSVLGVPGMPRDRKWSGGWGWQELGSEGAGSEGGGPGRWKRSGKGWSWRLYNDENAVNSAELYTRNG